jgi:recombination protein RecT
MATADDAKKALVAQAKEGEATLAKMIKAMTPQIALALPKHMPADRMARIALTMVRRNADLARCSAPSFMGALMTCAQLGLEPGPLGHAWIIPRQDREDGKGTGNWEATFQLGYKGVIELARRSGQMAKITARTVHANEVAQGKFSVRYEGALEVLLHVPLLFEEPGQPVLYYCAARLSSGEETFTPLRPADVDERHRKRSAAPNSPAWKNNYEAMAWKACVVEARRFWPQSVELEQAVMHEGSVRTDTDRDVLDAPPENPGWIDGEATDWPETAQPANGGGQGDTAK